MDIAGKIGRVGVLPSLLAAALCVLPGTLPAMGEEWRADGVERVIAISDVHGDYNAMVATLARAGVIDEANNWSAADSHLVITGDLLDRGPDSRKVMDLVMQLEPLAAAAGGQVHLLLGNHEVMNLVGDLRYVAIEEYAAFAADEDPAERERWFRHHLAQQTVSDEAAERSTWNDQRPPGFFAHRRAFRSDGTYGRWLLEKPLIVVINGTAFVHGGLSPKVAELGLEGVNGRLKAELVEYVEQLAVLNDAGVLAPGDSFFNQDDRLEALPADPNRPANVIAAIDTVKRLNGADIHTPDSPLWYRGNVGCGALIELDRLIPALDAIGASRVVIGHTPTLTRQVLSRLDGRVVEIDTGMLNAYYSGTGNALVIEGDRLTVVNQADDSAADVHTHPRRVGLRDAALSAERLLQIFAAGAVERVSEADSGELLVSVEFEGDTAKARFIPHPRGRGFIPEMAAYRLDRFLELGMVPVTVERQLNGKNGVLQFMPGAQMNEAERSASRRGSSAWCPLPEQWDAMYVFDALIHNPGRPQENMVYSQDNWQLVLTGHADSFVNTRSKPAYLKGVPLDVGSRWQERLGALTDEVIADELGAVLDKRRLRALGKRRDALLKDAAK